MQMDRGNSIRRIAVIPQCSSFLLLFTVRFKNTISRLSRATDRSRPLVGFRGLLIHIFGVVIAIHWFLLLLVRPRPRLYLIIRYIHCSGWKEEV